MLLSVNNYQDQGNAKCFVHYQVSMNKRQSWKTKLKVNEGGDVDSFIEGIKEKGKHFFASVDSFQIEVSTAEEPEKILDSLEKWTKNMHVCWIQWNPYNNIIQYN
jgi:hypothetical protein